MKKLLFLPIIVGLLFAPQSRAKDFVIYEGHNGPGKGKHVVFLSGDEEYRSEEGLPQMAKILAERHGFKCTVLFAIDPTDHAINPKITTNMPGAEALDSADVIVMALRFREWPDATMKHFVDAYLAGKPIIALRTSTHAFNYSNSSQSPYAKFSYNSKSWPGGFGKQVLGETWVAHHGAHKKEATRGIIEPSAAGDPLLRGVTDLFGDSDVYTANPASDAKILVRGQVVNGMSPSDPPVEGAKNNPMQPVVWTRLYKNEHERTNEILCTTMGAATDLLNEGLRRLIVNAVYWGAGLDVPQKADVAFVGDYHPTMYGFDGFVKGVKVADLEGGNGKSSAGTPNAAAATAAAPTRLELRQGDHIALIGNTLPDRFQHSGWLESFIYLGHPNLDLVVRNLAVAGDEVKTRHRPQNFGSPDDWLKKTEADVILAFFGFNESFHGEGGIEQFKTDLREFLTHTAAQNYSGRGAPRVVLFSPIANEKHQDPNFADPTANNANLTKYTEAMKAVAAERGVLFVDLFAPSQNLFTQVAAKNQSLTINGMHLTDDGDALIGQVIYRALFGEDVGPHLEKNKDLVTKLRAAVIDKSEQWHARYRTIDGNNVYGSRAPLAYQPNKGGFVSEWNPPEPYVTNFKVMQDEMTQRDVMTANRDKRIWAVAKGGDLAVDDSNLPPVAKVKSNFPGPNPDESFQFLNAEQAISKMKVHSGMKVNLFASEEKFPELAKPVQMAWDTKGRLWVAVWPNYPERTPDSKVGDSLLVLEDTDGDGKADKCTHFIDDLNGPTGFQFYKDGVLVMEAPDMWFVRDTKGGTKANSIERVLMGLSSADSHHTANSICLEPGGAIYLSDGVFHRTQVETATGPVRNNDAAIYRYEPRTAKFERYVPYGFANPHGRVFDYWGNDIITDGTGNNSYFGPGFSGHIDYPAKHEGMKEFWDRPSRPCAGTGLLTSRHFPPELQGNFLNCNVISFQGIYNVKVIEDGSGLKGVTQEDLVSSTDLNFRPVSVDVGPDGAIYFLDWQNPIIGHMQHHLRDPNRDHSHGRIYRITYQGRPLMKPPKIDGQPVPALLELLKEPENQIREWARIELGKHDTREVVSAAEKWADKLDIKDSAYAHNLTEALWVHQCMNVVNVPLLKRVMALPEPHARAAAGRVLCYWRDRVPDAPAMFKTLADDENPRVRLEAVRAASFFSTPEALEVALTILRHPMDYYLDYTLNETMRQLEPLKKQVLEKGTPVASDNPAGRDFLFHSLKTDELLKLQRSVPVLEAILARADASDSDRMLALADLAKARGQNRVVTLIDEVNSSLLGAPREPRPAPSDAPGQSSSAKKKKKGNSAPAITGSMIQQSSGAGVSIMLARLLPLQNPDELKAQTAQLTKLTNAAIPEVRQSAVAALMLADGSIDSQWTRAGNSERQLADVLEAIPLLPDQDFRARAFDKTAALLKGNSASEAVQRGAIRALVSMHHDYETVFGLLSALIQRKQSVQAAAQGILAVPRSQWPRAQAGPAAAAFVDWARTIPTDRRTTPDYLQVIQLAGELAGLAPAEQAQRLRADLKQLRVAVFLVRTVREQMRYDTTRLVVEAGKPFEIIFENGDFMPHNLVVVQPGVRDKIGPMTPSMRPDQLDDQGRAYLPIKDGVLGATRLLQTGQSESVKLTAPAKEGDYDYFCSYPAHYQLMWGSLVVTKDVDAYLQQHPETPVQTAPASNPFDDGGPGQTTAHKHSH